MRAKRAVRARAARAAPTHGAVPTAGAEALRQQRVFATLPPSSARARPASTTVRIDLERPGRASTNVRGPRLDQRRGADRSRCRRRSRTARRCSAIPRRSRNISSSWVAVAATPVIRRSRGLRARPSSAQTRARIDPGADGAGAPGEHAVARRRRRSRGSRAALINPFIATRLDVAFVETLRYVIPRTFDRVMAYPHLLFPLSKKLETLAPEVFLPGVGVLPNDFIMAVKTNPRFVEALMIGANHEMGREMLWQGLPDRPARHAVPAFLAAPRRRERHRADPRMDRRAARRAAGEHGDAGAADSRPAARALPDPVDLRVPDRRAARTGRAAAARRSQPARPIRRKWIRTRSSCR